MAVAVNVDGLCQIWVGTGTEDDLELLGYTRNGAELTGEAFMLDVPGDENGGDDGPPVEIESLGEIYRIRLELTKYDPSIADKVCCRLKSGTAGVPGTPGQLVFSGTKYFRLLLKPLSPADGATAVRPWNFLRAVPKGAIELNKGTKYSTLIMEWECHKTKWDDDPVNTLFNSTTD